MSSQAEGLHAQSHTCIGEEFRGSGDPAGEEQVQKGGLGQIKENRKPGYAWSQSLELVFPKQSMHTLVGTPDHYFFSLIFTHV